MAEAVGMGIAATVIIGISFLTRHTDGHEMLTGEKVMLCSCDCYQYVGTADSLATRMKLVLRHEALKRKTSVSKVWYRGFFLYQRKDKTYAKNIFLLLEYQMPMMEKHHLFTVF